MFYHLLPHLTIVFIYVQVTTLVLKCTDMSADGANISNEVVFMFNSFVRIFMVKHLRN